MIGKINETNGNFKDYGMKLPDQNLNKEDNPIFNNDTHVEPMPWVITPGDTVPSPVIETMPWVINIPDSDGGPLPAITGKKQDDYTFESLTKALSKTERNNKYGPELKDLSEEERFKFENAKSGDYLKCDISNLNPPKIIAHGVVQTEYGKYTETDVTLYNGKSYEELTPEERAKVDDYEKQIKERYNDINPLGTGGFGRIQKLPEPPFEITHEVHVSKN